jgi:hypothetical protein
MCLTGRVQRLRVAGAPRGGANDSIGVVGLYCSEETRSGQSWMMTVEPIGISSAPQMKSIAGLVTRMQPCEAG